jgi:hypothetical protein
MLVEHVLERLQIVGEMDNCIPEEENVHQKGRWPGELPNSVVIGHQYTTEELLDKLIIRLIVKLLEPASGNSSPRCRPSNSSAQRLWASSRVGKLHNMA